MVSFDFTSIGSFNGAISGPQVINNPTVLEFGPDGRLYVAEQNGAINAFTVALQNGQYVATDVEELLLPNGGGVVQSLQNHNDDGSSISSETTRQVTGFVITGTATNPVLYVSSSDPRIGQNGEVNLDTNSGVVTQVTWNGSEWEAVDIIRGLPRSEENHAVNGLELSPDGSTLYVAVGGNTNNGAPSQFFSYAGEYALSGTILEVDLNAINALPILTDPAGGQNGAARQFVYDLPTLDDPTVPNVTDGVGENAAGLDEASPWGGNDGFNQAILPADAPFEIFADGFRNHYGVVLTEAGQLYTIDNGSNAGLGGDPIFVNGEPAGQPNDGGTGDPEPLFLVEEGGYYGHPNPTRSNQTLPWTVYNDNGDPDTSLSPNNVSNLADLVPTGVNIANDFLIDPSKFTGDPARLAESGIRVPRSSAQSNALVTLGSSSNGFVEYTDNVLDGALQGALIVAQFNGNVTLLNLNDAGTALEPFIDPGADGVLGTADDEVLAADGVFPLVTGQTLPLDVTVGPDGSLWVAEFGASNINVFGLSDVIVPSDDDFDNDGIPNVNDPFIRDASNGGSVLVTSGQTLLWDFDANQDNNLPGPGGYGTGLTGVMVNGVTDFEQFFQEPSTLPDQNIKFDNVKLATAGGGGTTTIEFVSNGDTFEGNNTGEYLFHTGVTIDPAIDDFTITWGVFNPANAFTGPFQQIGGYIGTGDQSNYLKIVAGPFPGGEIQLVLEDNDVLQAESFIQADDLLTVPLNQKIFLELQIDPSAATATPTVTYETGDGNTTTVSGTAVDLGGTAVLDAILGDYTVQGQTSGLAVGLFSSNVIQPEANTFQAIFDEIEITTDGTPPVPGLSVSDISVSEGSGTATFTVNLSQLADEVVTVDYNTVDGTAAAGNDYGATSGTLTFAPGTTSQTFTVDILEDVLEEGTETFSVNLTNSVGADIIDGLGTAIILDNDIDVDANILYRVNVGGEEVTAPDGQLAWSEDTSASPSPFRVGNGGNNIFTSGAAIDLSDPNLPAGAQVATIFQSERFDPVAPPTLQWEFAVDPGTEIEVRLYFAELFNGITDAGQRVFDVALEGVVPTAFDDIDPFGVTGQLNTASVFSTTTTITDGSVSLEFLNNIENPALKAVEILQVGDTGLPPALAIADVTVNEDAGTATFAVSLSAASDAAITVDFASADGTAVAGSDYTGGTGTLTFAPGETTQNITVAILDDTEVEGTETFTVDLANAAGATITDASATGTIVDDDGAQTLGEAVLTITIDDGDNVQASNFGSNSFQITNTGEKTIAQIDIDVTNALFPDTVFDPFGIAGDTLGKELVIDTDGDTGVVAPSNASYIGVGGTAGFEGLQLVFDEAVNGGFENGETLGFSVDMDPNSIAGADKTILDSGAAPVWDIGGVSGAELIGSSFTVTFTDGTTATGQLQGTGNQASAQGLATQAVQDASVALTVNGLSAGGVGTYEESGPTVIINGTAGETARVVLAKGFIQPTTNEFFNSSDPADQAYAPVLQAQLDALAASDFPANNAVEFQTVDVLLTGAAQDISGLFDFAGVPVFDFAGEDELPLGFVASIIDPSSGSGGNPGGIVFSDAFESDLGWITNPNNSDTATTGQWEVANPEATEFNGAAQQLGETISGSQALVTQAAAGSGVGSFDLDGGITSALSPDIFLPGNGNLSLDLSYYLAHLGNANTDDFLRITLVGEQSSQVLLEELGDGTIREAAWTNFSADISQFAGETVALLVEAQDGGTGSLVEAAVEDVVITLSGLDDLPTGPVTDPIYLQFATLPELSIADVTVNEGDGTATFAVSLSEASDTAITVDFATADGTAIAGSDYTGDTGTLTFAAGATSQNITVTILDDAELEADETFTVNLANAAGAEITDASAIGTIVDNEIPPPSEGILFTTVSEQTLNGFSFNERDIVLFDGTDFSRFFDGSDVGLTNNAIEINAFDVISENEILLSFDEAVNIPGVGTVDDSDLVLFTATSLGENTAGSFSLYFDGSDVGLTTNGEDIDGLASLADGSLLISTTGNVTVSGISRADEDVLQFAPTSLGASTTGTFSVFVDGSDIGLGGEDVDAFGTDAAGDLFFSTTNGFSVAGVSGADEDVFGFTPSSTGVVTSGSFVSELLFDGSQFGLGGNDLKGIDLTFGGTGGGPGGNPIRLEAEAVDSLTGFSLESVDAASGGQALSFLNSPVGSGSATFGFDETPGTYNIIVGTFDENDGVAQFDVLLNDVESGTTTAIGSIELDANLGSNLPNAQTIVSPTVAFGVALTPGDSLTVNGFEEGAEFARLDYIELVPVNG